MAPFKWMSARRAATVASAIAAVIGLGSVFAISATAQQYAGHDVRCEQLERELANDWADDGQSANDRAQQIESQIRQYNKAYQQAQSQAEKSDCYEQGFFFGRRLVRSRQCIALNDRVEDARRQLARLEDEKTHQSQRGPEGRRDQIVDELRRAGCNPNAGSRQANRGNDNGGLFGGIFGGGNVYNDNQDNYQTSRIEPYATYRTMCVRMCDGYYFPINFSQVPSRFGEDVNQCQSQCAAPARLFVYRNPGEEVQQMVSADGSQPYSKLPNAFKYRKKYVKGCSCKQAEYDPAEINKADAAGPKDKKTAANEKAAQ